MAMVLADRVQEVTTTVGTGTLTLGGATTGGFQTFASVMATGDTAPISVVDLVNNLWATGTGTMNPDGSLSLATQASSNSNNPVSWVSNGGRTIVMLTPTASYLKNNLVVGAAPDPLFVGTGIVQLDGAHWTTNYRRYAELPATPTPGNTLIGVYAGSGAVTPPPGWSTLLANVSDAQYENAAIYQKTVGTYRNSRLFGPSGVNNGNSGGLGIVEVTGYTQFSAFHGAPSSQNGNDFNLTLPTCSATSSMLMCIEWDDNYVPISSYSSQMRMISDFASGDCDANHGAYLFWIPGSMSGQTVFVSLTAGVGPYKIYTGVVMTP